MIDPACKVKSVIMEAFQNASFLCEEYYDCAPEIEIKGSFDIFYKFSNNMIYCRADIDKERQRQESSIISVLPSSTFVPHPL